MIEPTRQQDEAARRFALTYDQVMVTPPTHEGGPVRLDFRKRATYAYQGGDDKSRTAGLVSAGGCTVTATGGLTKWT